MVHPIYVNELKYSASMIHFYVNAAGQVMANGKQMGQAETRVDGLVSPGGCQQCQHYFTFDINSVTDALLHVETWEIPAELTSCLRQVRSVRKNSQRNLSPSPHWGFCFAPGTERPVEVWGSAGAALVANPGAVSPAVHLPFYPRGAVHTWDMGTSLHGVYSGCSRTLFPNLHVDRSPSVDFIKIWSMLWTYE